MLRWCLWGDICKFSSDHEKFSLRFDEQKKTLFFPILNPPAWGAKKVSKRKATCRHFPIFPQSTKTTNVALETFCFSRSSALRSMIVLNFFLKWNFLSRKFAFLLLRALYIHISVLAFERLRSDDSVDHQPWLPTLFFEEKYFHSLVAKKKI